MVRRLLFRYTQRRLPSFDDDEVACQRAHLRESTMNKFLETVREKTGIYSSGINPASAAGFLLPVLFVVLVGGGIAAYLIWTS